MFSDLYFVLLCQLALTFAEPLQDARDQTLQLSPVDVRLPAKTSNGDIATRLNASNELHIQCDGEKYGYNPKVTDCQNARSYYKRSKQLYTYGERHSGHGVDVFPLPYRLMGDKGLCYLEPALIDRSLGTGVASINHLSDAAYELILKCAVRQSKGGIATGIGGENIALILGAYEPDIQCRGPFDAWSSCRSIVGDMPAYTTPEVFGPPNDPTVRVPLPQFLESADRKCTLRIFGKGKADTTSWFKIWEAVSAVYAVCLRHQKVGTFRSLGERGNIFFTMSAKATNLGISNTSAVLIDGALSED